MKKAKYLLLTIVSIYIFVVQPVFAIGILIGYVFGYFSAIEGMKQTDKILGKIDVKLKKRSQYEGND